MARKRKGDSAVERLVRYVESAPCVALRLTDAESQQISDSRLGFSEFTLAKPHDLLRGAKTPTLCLIFGKELPTFAAREQSKTQPNRVFAGIISSRNPITTLDTRFRIHHAVQIKPNSESQLKRLIRDASLSTTLRKKLASRSSIVRFSPRLSGAVVKALADIAANRQAIALLARLLLEAPRRYINFAGAQEDALKMALKAFGLGTKDRALHVDLPQEGGGPLARIPIIEDSVIEHDARSIPGYTLVASDITGRAMFEKHGERLEVFTANRRDLEHVFGVDLIYVNLTKRNIVMVQYKMLEPDRRTGEATDWLYRPDTKMADEIARMRRFSKAHAAGQFEYRLNPEVFYLKFVKRNGALADGAVITPLEHYERLVKDPQCRGPRNAVRITYSALGGRYMRQTAFLDLIQSGYIGAYADTTSFLSALVRDVLAGGRAVVAAVQSDARP